LLRLLQLSLLRHLRLLPLLARGILLRWLRFRPHLLPPRHKYSPIARLRGG
jgi:hypothetical protein